MKRLFLSVVVAIVVVTTMYAQSSLVATLSHNGEISVYHGASSLKQAMEAAAHGDIITLASGRYDAANITKAVTLRGAGIEEDATTGAFGTQIIGEYNINIADETLEHLTIEGIWNDNAIFLYGSLNNAMFQKSRFQSILISNNNVQVNSLTIIHCRIEGNLQLPTITSATLISCVVRNPSNVGGNMEFTNCIVRGDVLKVYNSLFTNCLFCTSLVSWGILNNTNMATYCAAVLRDSSVFQNVGKLTNKDIASEADFNALFKSGSYYEMTDEAKSEYVGQDGKEMGIYGGNLPYETRILSPQITKCDVAAKTTADGKLSVDIEVKAAE